MIKAIATAATVVGLLAGCQPGKDKDKAPSWQSPKPGISYNVCAEPVAAYDMPCVRREDDGRHMLYRENQKPREVEYLWKENDGSVRVRWIA